MWDNIIPDILVMHLKHRQTFLIRSRKCSRCICTYPFALSLQFDYKTLSVLVCLQFSHCLTWLSSLALEDGVLPDDATDAGLFGVSFLGGRGLSMPFSGGEWAGLARGVAGSWWKHGKCANVYVTATSYAIWKSCALLLTSLETSTTKSSLFSPSLSCKDDKKNDDL